MFWFKTCMENAAGEISNVVKYIVLVDNERWIRSVWNCNFKCFDLKACMENSAGETSNVVKYCTCSQWTLDK